MLHDEITELTRSIWARSKRLSKFSGLIGVDCPRVLFFSGGTTAGYASWEGSKGGKKYGFEVSFNLGIASRVGVDEFRSTIVHELAHVAVWVLCSWAKQNHGPEFREICLGMGGNGRTYHSYDLKGMERGRKGGKIWMEQPPEV